MVLTNFQNNTELKVGEILASSNVHIRVPIEPAGDKQTQMDGIQS